MYKRFMENMSAQGAVIKWIVAFLVPIAWTIIFYPLMRKVKKAYPYLIVIATLLSFLALVLTDVLEKISPVFGDAVIYLSGIFFGTAALSFFFISKSRWLNEAAQAEAFSSSSTGQLHLRHVMQMSILLEDEGQKFYAKLAEKSSNPKVKELCLKLVEEEKTHKRLFEGLFSRWLPFYIDKESMRLFEDELRRKGIFLDPPPLDTSELEMLKYAIDQENKMAEFYRAFEDVFPEAWRRMIIEQLVREEKEHAKRLMTLLPSA
jgi:rubrerythrin